MFSGTLCKFLSIKFMTLIVIPMSILKRKISFSYLMLSNISSLVCIIMDLHLHDLFLIDEFTFFWFINKLYKDSYVFGIGFHVGYVLPSVLARWASVIYKTSKPWEIGCWSRIHSIDLGTRYLLCQWKNSIFS